MVNRMRATRAHRNNRRSHHAIGALRVTKEEGASVPHLRHMACATTGMYRGRQVIDVSRKIKRAEAEAKN